MTPRRAWIVLALVATLACGGAGSPSSDAAGEDPGTDPRDGQTEPLDRIEGPDRAELPDLVEAGPDVVHPDRTVHVQAPVAVQPGEPFPVIVRVVDAAGRPDRGLSGTTPVVLAATGASLAEVVVRHGVGSAVARLEGQGVSDLQVRVGEVKGTARVSVLPVPLAREVEGELAGADLDWPADTDVRVTADARVPAGATLQIGAGARVRLAIGVNLFVRGRLDASGTAAAPVWFTADGDGPWGGLVHEGGDGSYEHVLVSRGGGDPTRTFGHSKSQPVLLVTQAEVRAIGAAFLDNTGKGPSGDRARFTLEGGLVSRCDTGGEWESSAVTLRDTWVLEIPSADGLPADDDNDGLYLHLSLADADGEPIPSLVERAIFAVGKDDGIDHNGATLVVRDARLEGFAHEGVAASNRGRVEVVNTLIRACEQGIEAGYGEPEVRVDHVVSTGNDVGLRLGDSYDKDVTGTLTVTNSIATGNRLHNVWNHVNKLDGPLAGHVTVSNSLVDDPEWDGKDGNVPGTPLFDATWHLLPGSPGQGAARDGTDAGLLP